MTKEEMIDKANEIIGQLVYDKHKLQKAYNYYNAKRDKEQFRYLEENYGLGSPTSVGFTPLLKKHVDALVGEYLGTPIIPKISCKDSSTLNNIYRDKQLQIKAEYCKFLEEHIKKALLNFIQGKDNTDLAIKKQLDDIKNNIEQNFVSEYEIAAQNIIEYIMQSKHTDAITKLRQLITNLLITGYTFFKVHPSTNKNNIEIDVLSPLNTFIEQNPNSPYVKDSSKAVVRRYLHPSEILAKYGKNLSAKDREEIKKGCANFGERGNVSMFVNSIAHLDADENYEGLPGQPNQSRAGYERIPVYEVEWVETDSNCVMHRYSVVRIGEESFIVNDVDEDVFRSVDNPDFCTISLNGVYFLNENYEPDSLILKCVHLQDQYDLCNYYQNALIANGGAKGDIIDLAMLPKQFGPNFEARILKALAYKKQGVMVIDSSQEGSEGKPMNTIFNGYDDTIQANVIQTFQLIKQEIEATISSITGVFRERLNGIEQRDAVTNIKQGAQNSFIITKHYFQQMDMVSSEILLDSLNYAKVVYKKGLTGSIILGDKQQKIFTALPEHYTLTDYDIRVVPSTQVMEEMQALKQLIPEFIKSGQLDSEMIFEALSAKSLTELKTKIAKAMQIKKQENDQITQLTNKLEETTQQLEKVTKELEAVQKQLKQADQEKLKLEQEKINLTYKVDWFKAQTDQTYKTEEIALKRKQLQLELAQIHDGNVFNDEIENI